MSKELESLRKLLEDATQGPWKRVGDHVYAADEEGPLGVEITRNPARYDAAAIATLGTLGLELLAVAEDVGRYRKANMTGMGLAQAHQDLGESYHALHAAIRNHLEEPPKKPGVT